MHEETPRPGNLYRAIAKDYTPKQAEMKICKYLEGLERRIAALENAPERIPHEIETVAKPKSTPKKSGKEVEKE